jgi:CRISPR-associated protein Cmr2
MSYLFVLTVGPVQEFIASARRSRDLWFGSWLLSELAKAAAHAIVSADGIDRLIFPAPQEYKELGPGTKLSVANKIVALIEQSPEHAGRAAQQAITTRLGEIRESAYEHIEGSFQREVAQRQVDDLPEIFWVAVPIEDPENPTRYKEARQQAETLLAARKVTRNFESAAAWASSIPKSSLDGLRESVIDERAYPPPSANAEQQRQAIRRLRLHYGVRAGERLCGVGLLKRHGNRGQNEGFFSTSHVAALPLLARLKPKDTQAVETYLNVYRYECGLTEREAREVLGKVPYIAYPVFQQYDGHLLFEERLKELVGEDEGGQTALRIAETALRQFLKNTLEGIRPLPYYALLHADGDHMGKTIEAQQTMQQHRRLSSKLTEFAGGVQKIVENDHQGSLVYAGGDDVLAFVPLHTVLHCAQALADNFRTHMMDFGSGEQADEKALTGPTLSVGVAINHHIEPLADALQLAHTAEKIAKGVKGKNALAITLSKRSGIDRTVAGKWGTLDKRLEKFVYLHRVEAIPDSAAYELQEMAHSLIGYSQAMRGEAVRILKRKRAERGKQVLAEKVVEDLTELFQQSDLPLAQLGDELIVARLLAQATQQADIEPETLPGAPAQTSEKERS